MQTQNLISLTCTGVRHDWRRDRAWRGLGLALLFCASFGGQAQMLLNIDCGVGTTSAKVGVAATGLGTNDFWNLYRHYSPRLTPGMTPVADGRLDSLKLADGTPTGVSISISNAPGVWGNTSGDAMFDTFVFAPNGSNMTVVLYGLEAGRYHFYLYSHADADVSGPQAGVFTLRSGTNVFGPLASLGAQGWRTNQPWIERNQYVLFRDVPVETGQAVSVEVAPGVNGIAVLNGLQILSRGTSSPRLPAALAKAAGPTNPPPYAATNILLHEVRYKGRVGENEARFQVTAALETESTNELSLPLFSGEVALVVPDLPAGLRITSAANQYHLWVSAPGRYSLSLELVAKITRTEPWRHVQFTGPPAAMASVSAEADAPEVEMQLLSGLPSEESARALSKLSGVLGADGVLSLRWQGKAAEVTRKSLVTTDTAATAVISPSVIRYHTQFRCEILQAPLPRLLISVPANQALTRVQGDQIRDWQVKAGPGPGLASSGQVLTIEFIKPVEKSYSLELFTEQTVEATAANAALVPPAPLQVERESGSFTVKGDDMLVEIEAAPGLRQVNAPSGALAAYRFNGRPVSIAAKLRRLEPVLKLVDRVTIRVEETRLLVTHALNVTVEKAGIYALDVGTPAGFGVSEVRGEGVDDWKSSGGKLRLSFGSRVIGSRKVEVQLEQAHRQLPETVVVQPLTVAGATNVTAQVGAASSPGLRVKTAELAGLREAPVNTLRDRSDELLAFVSEQADWRLTLAVERLSARVVAEVFNLVTIGDGLVGGSATIRYGIFSQGVQEYRVLLPAHWKNVEFTGANIRRKEVSSVAREAGAGLAQPADTNQVLWAIFLQDKVWGGYTLVITYDYQFDPLGATLDLAGAHPLEAERETGSLGLMTAASLKLTPTAPALPLRRVDESELSESDRALCTRPLLLAYRYTGRSYAHSARVSRFGEVPVLDAVADRIELTTVVTEEGQMLTQASFMVKNNEKQFQQFKLPREAKFWSSYVNGQSAKPERDGEWLLVPLPREANRDQTFAVDIVYAQKIELRRSLFPRRVELAAPVTDIPNTYAEWQLFAPVSQRLSGFGGTMSVARGTTYSLQDAWQEFIQFYGNLIERHFRVILLGLGALLLLVSIVSLLRRGMKGVVEVIVVVAILAVLAGMMLPALARAKAKSARISAVSNLKQIGLAARIWASDNGGYLPSSFDAMKNEVGSEKVLIDPNTGQRFIYAGAGKKDDDPNGIVAYSRPDLRGRIVAFADGSVAQMTTEQFEEALRRDAAVPRVTVAANQPAPTDQIQQQAVVPPPAPSGAPARLGGGVGGGGAPISPTVGAAPPPGPSPAQPTAAGVRPIRIDVPRSGQVFTFTKVLNASQEPLRLAVSMGRLQVYRTTMMVVQVCGFLAGLGMLWWCAGRRRGGSFWMAVASALVLASVSSLLVMWRLLGMGLIAAVPVVLLLLIGWGGWNWQQTHRSEGAQAASQSEPPPPPSTLEGGAAAGAGVVLVALLGLLVSASSSWAQDARASLRAVPSSNLVTLVSASYTGTVREKAALFDASLLLSSAGTNQLVPLFGEDVAVQSFTATVADVKLVRTGRAVGVWLPGRTNVTLQLKLAIRLEGDVTRRTLAFGIPPALASRVSVNLDEAEADVELPTAVALRRVGTNQQTRVEAVLGAANRLEMTWRPRVKRAAETAATVFVQNVALVTLGNGVMNTRAIFDYQITQGEMRQARLLLPAGQRLLRVEGEFIRTWESRDDALVIELLKPLSTTCRLTIETEKVLEPLPATVKVELPRALDVSRETGLVALRSSEEVSLAVEDARDLQRVDAEEFHRAAAEKKDGVFSAFRFLRSGFALAVRVEAVQPQIEAVVRNGVRVGSESARLNAQVDYTIKRAGVFSLRLALPAGWRLEEVRGSNVLQWVEREEAAQRLLEVALKERALGALTLNVLLALPYKEPPAVLALAGVHPIGTQKLNGFVTVTTEVGLAAKTAGFEGLTEVPFATVSSERLAGGGSALAYKFIVAEPTPAPAWRLSVSTEAVEPWVRAEIVNFVTVTETLLSGRSLVKFDVANAPVKEFRMRLPAAFKNVEMTGANIRRRDETNGEWRLELQGKVRGDYVLTVTWELPKSEKTNLVELTGVQALGVERETGWLVILARPPLQVSDRSTNELVSKIDVRELPEWAGQVEASTVLAYRYLRPGYTLALEARRFDEAEVLQALIESARLTTVVADDGQMMTEVSLSIRSQGRQHLAIELPEESTVWSAFVAGEPVRPSLGEEAAPAGPAAGGAGRSPARARRLLLPLERSVASEGPLAIELCYISLDKFPKRRGPVALKSPAFDVPMKNARWELYLPPDYDYHRFEGTMNRAVDTVAPLAQDYSLAQYNVQQRAQEEQQKVDVRNELKVARDNLKEGNLRQAIGSFSRSKIKGQQMRQEAAEDRDLKQIEQDVRKAQSSNLIIAQNAFFIDNNARLGEQQQVQMPSQAGAVQTAFPAQQVRGGGAAANLYLNYDADVAGQQWDKLEKAQQVVQARVAPLRVNLPTRGLRFSFAQVLQTEVRKPMTILMLAESTKAPSWAKRLGLFALGFGVLWALVATVNRRREA